MSQTRHNLHTATAILMAAALWALPGRLLADEEVDKQTPSLFVNFSGGYSIYKSELVASNDTSTTVGYGFGVYGGEGRTIGLFLQREMSSFAFPLVESDIAMTWQDTVLRYRMGMFYAGLVLTHSDWLVTVPPLDDAGEIAGDPQEFFQVQASGYGGNFGMQIPLSSRGLIYVDGIYSSALTGQVKARASDVPEDVAAPEEVVIGNRMAMDIGGSFDLTRKLVDGIAGFKYRTYNISVDGTSYAEQHHTTYLGLRFNWTF